MPRYTMLRAVPLLFLLSSLLSAQTVDTLFYGNSPKLHKNPYGAGYIAGTNSYGDLGKYQRFDLKEPMHVVGAKLWIAKKQVVKTPDTVTIVLRRTSTGKQNYVPLSGGPGALITSLQTTTDQFDTTKLGNVFLFSAPVNVNAGASSPESLFVGLEWTSAMDDTFALFADSAKQGDNKNRAWEKVSGYTFTFQRFNEQNDYSWLLDADLWIALLYKKGLLSVQQGTAVPSGFALEQNYPNPFNPSTAIVFSIPSASLVTLTVYDILGKAVAVLVDERLETGRYSMHFSAASLPSGVYFYHLRAGTASQTRRMLLVK